MKMDNNHNAYTSWVNDLYNNFKNNPFIKEYNLEVNIHNDSDPEYIGLEITQSSLKVPKTLIIDSSTIKPFYRQIGDPNFSYIQSLNFATNECIKSIKIWMGL